MKLDATTGYLKKELKSFLDPNVNKNQEYLIPEKEIKIISHYLEDIMGIFDYH